MEERVVRVLLPLDLIRRMDELVGTGNKGYQTRQELMREALEAYILDLSYEPAPAEPPPRQSAVPERRSSRTPSTPERPLPQRKAVTVDKWPTELSWTVLRAPEHGFVMQNESMGVADEPFFGLHNRDYPSLWAAHYLASMTVEGPAEVERFRTAVTKEAWAYAERLALIEEKLGEKLTALFPKNRAKPQSSEGAFLTFAIGDFATGAEGIKASGPLFAWRLAQLEERDGGLFIGLTGLGYELLEALEGLSLALPHAPEHARRFFDHLRKWAPRDWSGFVRVIEEVGREISRVELVKAFGEWRPDWTPNEWATNAAGYLARAREWGLVEPKQVEGRYVLTAFGRDQFDFEGRRK